MAKVLNTYEQADFERLAAFYPYRNEHGLTQLDRFYADYPYSKKVRILFELRQQEW